MTVTYSQTPLSLKTNPTIDSEKTAAHKQNTKIAFVGSTTVICNAYDCTHNHIGACCKRKIVMGGMGPTCASYTEDSTENIPTDTDPDTILDGDYDQDLDPLDLHMSQRMYAIHSQNP